MTRVLLVLVLVAFVLLCYGGMRAGWLRRTRAQSGIAAPHELMATEAVAGPWAGTYLGATSAGAWLDRITAHSLGAKSPVSVSITRDGVNVVRAGERSFTIPKADLISARADTGIAGRAYERGGIVVVTFRLGDTLIDAGFRFPNTDDHVAALSALANPTEVQ